MTCHPRWPSASSTFVGIKMENTNETKEKKEETIDDSLENC